MNERRIIKYWSNFFGIDAEEIKSSGVSIVPHKSLKGYNGAWIFKAKNRIIFSSREQDLPELKARIKDNPPHKSNLFSKNYIEQLFEPNIKKIIGPTYQGFYDSNKIEGVSKNVVKLDFGEHEKEIKKLSNSGDIMGWKNSGLNKTSKCIYGFQFESAILSIANYKIIEGDVGFIGVYTDPKHRGKGYGQEVVKKTISALAENDKLAIYQTLLSNMPSKSITDKVGISEFGRNIAIRLY